MLRNPARLCALLLALLLPAWPAAAETVEAVLPYAGVDRTYLLTRPDSLMADAPGVPLVVVLHGAGANGGAAMAMTRFDELAEAEGFFAAFPDGSSRLNRLFTWNAVHCCGFAAAEGIDDVGFVAALIDQLVAELPIDPDRIYVVGMSNGGMLAQLLAATLPGRVAAIGSVVGGLFGDEPVPPLPVPVILINGGTDRVIPPAGGAIGSEMVLLNVNAPPLMPSDYQAQFWATAAGCQNAVAPKQLETTIFEVARYECAPYAPVEYYLVYDNGHAWPGDTSRLSLTEVPSTEFDATAMVWAFFQRHRLSDRLDALATGTTPPAEKAL